jgi:DNA-binding protein HU-beta
MNRKDLVEELSQRFEGNREVAAQALDSVVDVITKSISAGEKVVISGFGEFERRARGAGAKAGEYVPEFKPGKELREVVSGSREWRDRVSQSLAVVPAAAADAAEQAGRVAAGTLRSVAEKARELATELASIGATGDAASSSAAQPRQPAKKAPAKKASAAKKSTAKKAPATKSSAKKTSAKKAPAKKAAAAKKAPAKKAAAAKAPAKKSAATKSSSTRRTSAKKAPAKKASGS